MTCFNKIVAHTSNVDFTIEAPNWLPKYGIVQNTIWGESVASLHRAGALFSAFCRSPATKSAATALSVSSNGSIV